MIKVLKESTNIIVGKQISAIASKFNCTESEAERYFRCNIGVCDVFNSLIESIKEDIEDQKTVDKEQGSCD